MYSLGLLGGFIRCLLCLRQVDLKAFVAYSSIVHMGMLLAGFVAILFIGCWGGIYIMIGHGFCSSCLFFLLYVFYERFYRRSILLLKGLVYVLPIGGLFVFVFSVLNMGVPPSLPFFSEISLIVSFGGVRLFS